MTILYCSHYSELGGANSSLLNLVCSLRKYKVDAIVLLPENGPYERILEENGIKYYVVKYYDWTTDIKQKKKRIAANVKNMSINYLASRKVLVKLKDDNIDLVHTNDILTVVGAYIAQELKVPHIWHIREFLSDDYNLTFRYSDAYVKRLLGRSNCIIGISQAILDHFQNYIKDKNYRLVYNGIPIDDNRHFLEKNRDFTLFFAGGDNEAKGFGLIKSIIPDLVKNGVYLIIAGSIKDCNIKNELTQYAPYVECIGFTSDISEYRARCHASLVLSKREAFGRVTIESMLEGTIVIATSTGANGEIIEDENTGILLDGNSSSVLFKTIMNIKDNYLQYKEIENRAYKYVIENFDIERVAKEVNDIYHLALEDK